MAIVQVTLANEEKYFVNTEHVVIVEEDNGTTMITLSSNKTVRVKETLLDLVERMNGAIRDFGA